MLTRDFLFYIEVIFMLISLSLMSLCVYLRKPFLGLQGHNSSAFLPSGYLTVWEWNAHSEHRDCSLVGGCGQNLFL